MVVVKTLFVRLMMGACLLWSAMGIALAEEKSDQKPVKLSKTEAAALKNLVQRLDHIKTISGNFVQYGLDQKGSRVSESRGSFMAERPGKFYWQTEAPLAQTVYSDGTEVTVYDPDLEQATIQPVSGDIQRTPAVLFSGGMKDIGVNFKVDERQWPAEDGGPEIVQFVLTPRAKDNLFAQLRVRFEDQTITEMRILDSLGQQSTVSFENVVLNPVIPPGMFNAKLPPRTDIIREVPVQPGK